MGKVGVGGGRQSSWEAAGECEALTRPEQSREMAWLREMSRVGRAERKHTESLEAGSLRDESKRN